MKNNEVRRSFLVITMLCMLLGIALSRGVSIKHNMTGHPDEHIFYGSTELLMYDVLYGDDYEPLKPYPEGTYVFRLPFHIAAQENFLDDNYDISVRLWGRVASVFYYSVGAALGLWLVVRVLNGGKAGAVIYALTTVFSLFQLEISRYGTFDPISFMVLMLVTVFCALYIRKGKKALLFTAAFFVGVAAAGKYPLAYFFLLPMFALILSKHEKKKFLYLFLMGAFVLLGFVLFSPSVMKDPFFLLRTIRKELGGYVVGGNSEGYSTVPESFFSVIVYQLFYSDLPLATFFAPLCALRLGKEGEASAERSFFTVVLPVTVLGFLVYNCLLTTFFLRTLFPFFCFCAVYASAGLGKLCSGRKMRVVAVLLCAVMALRGGYFVYLLSDDTADERSAEVIYAKLDGAQIDEVIWFAQYFPSPALEAEFSAYERQHVSINAIYNHEFPTLRPGQLLVTGSLDHGWIKRCVFPPNKEHIINALADWKTFKAENQQYYVGRLYPEYYYSLFGWWVHGSTATNYEFTNNYVYYCPAE